MRRWILAAVVLVFAGIPLAILASPIGVYLWGLTLLPSDRTPSDPSRLPALALELKWATFGGESEPHFVGVTPYGYLRKEHDTELNTAFAAGRRLLIRGRRQYPKPWLVSGPSATIWISRNWSAPEALATILGSANYGHGFESFIEASEGYFGSAPSELSPYQVAQLVALTWSVRFDPWCSPERSDEKAREILARHWHPIEEGRRALRPKPPDACS